jgi:hypothetical protein
MWRVVVELFILNLHEDNQILILKTAKFNGSTIYFLSKKDHFCTIIVTILKQSCLREQPNRWLLIVPKGIKIKEVFIFGATADPKKGTTNCEVP